jgi:hypothetical protein
MKTKTNTRATIASTDVRRAIRTFLGVGIKVVNLTSFGLFKSFAVSQSNDAGGLAGRLGLGQPGEATKKKMNNKSR